MPPNSISRTPVVRAISSECEQKEIRDRNAIRTDFVLQNIYCYLLKDVYKFEALKAINDDEENFFNELILIVDDFKLKSGEKIHVLCTTLVLKMDTLASSLYGVANELFVEGYTWSRIIALFVFVSILTIHCLENNLPENAVRVLFENFCSLVKERLKPWIDDHGGWNGVLSLKSDNGVLSLKSDNTPAGWTKNLLNSTGTLFGTLAEISFFRC